MWIHKNLKETVNEKEHMAWQTDYCIMKEGMSILRGWKSVPGMNSSERENGKRVPLRLHEHMAWQTDYCIMKEGMHILRGRKSVPGMNSSKREMERGCYSAFT
uniref:Uncharacterized protein n=1 Tax=Tanacetum cinerariifolium TaxID=118510 RepID=A0A699HSX0_TANCI|nr:hypothetical protein [Tanacetum cinerariifolium]